MTKTILILAANPKNTSRLRLDQEVREIDNGLQRARRRDEFNLKQVWAVRRSDFRRAMLDLKPNIVHFCGHGSGEEGIAFEDENGQAKLVSTEALSGFFELFADKVEYVVLNACYSKVQAEAIAKHIPHVIGMNKAIGDTAAIEFAVAFYDALGAGETIEFAYKLACNAIQLSGMPENLTPTLISRQHIALQQGKIDRLTKKARRPLPVFILLDASGSMAGTRIELMRQGIVRLIEHLQWYDEPVEILLSIITFGSHAEVLLEPTPVIEIKQLPDIRAGGATALGSALKLLANLLNTWTLPSHTRILRPMIIVAMDGSPTDDWQPGLAEIKKSVIGSRADRLVLAIGDGADYKVLREIGSLGVLPLVQPEDMVQITNFFRWVCTSVTSVKDDDVARLLPPPPPDGFQIVW
ncbi:MAG: VWA domain-containing protein [Ardenticatenaceae bacterium]|nr:VWA domain-containing protein [Ardenticatenaceae bacterium]